MIPEPIDPRSSGEEICLVLEGTYPFVPGGVSSWVQTLVTSLSELTFNILHIGPYPGAYTQPCYQVPGNVVRLEQVHCNRAAGGVPRAPIVRPQRAPRQPTPRVIVRLRRSDGGGGRGADRSAGDDHRARDLRARARAGAGAHLVDPRPRRRGSRRHPLRALAAAAHLGALLHHAVAHRVPPGEP